MSMKLDKYMLTYVIFGKSPTKNNNTGQVSTKNQKEIFPFALLNKIS